MMNVVTDVFAAYHQRLIITDTRTSLALGRLLIMLLMFVSHNSHADLPLTMEELLTKSDSFRVEWGFSYANSDRNQVNTHFDVIQTTPDSQLLLPVDVTQQQQNSDLLTMTLGLRYGYSRNTEFYTRLTGMTQDTRWYDKDGSNQLARGAESEYHKQWQDWVLGVNHQVSGDNDTLALLLFAELSAAENLTAETHNHSYGRSGQLGLTTYRTIDPIVLSLTAGYRWALMRQHNQVSIDPGDLFFINPSVGFAVNNEITLTGGLRLHFRGKDKLANTPNTQRTTQTQLEFGVGYAVAQRLTININLGADISGNRGAQTGMNFSYKLSK